MNLKTNCVDSYTGLDPVEEASDSGIEPFGGVGGPDRAVAVARRATSSSSAELFRRGAFAVAEPPGAVVEAKLNILPKMDHLFLYVPSLCSFELSLLSPEPGLL